MYIYFYEKLLNRLFDNIKNEKQYFYQIEYLLIVNK